jgi:3-methyladenine DNA glycosylase AlkD
MSRSKTYGPCTIALPADRSTAGVRRHAKAVARELRDAKPRDVVDACVGLAADGERQFAYELVQAHAAVVPALTGRDVEAMATGLEGWAAVDHFATYVSGPAWREGRVNGALIRGWLESDDVWLRRAAVVSTVALNNRARGGVGDTARTLAVCFRVVDDHHDMIVKAHSWALRELAKRDPIAAARFVDEHEHRLAARVLREVRNKLRTGLKNPKRPRRRTR